MLDRHPGWQVCGEAPDGTATLQKALELKPDVIVRDWVMPGLDAAELTRQVAASLPDTAVVIFSFYDMPELEAAAKAAGVHKVATKNLDSLIGAVEEVLRSPARRLLNASAVPPPADSPAAIPIPIPDSSTDAAPTAQPVAISPELCADAAAPDSSSPASLLPPDSAKSLPD